MPSSAWLGAASLRRSPNAPRGKLGLERGESPCEPGGGGPFAGRETGPGLLQRRTEPRLERVGVVNHEQVEPRRHEVRRQVAHDLLYQAGLADASPRPDPRMHALADVVGQFFALAQTIAVRAARGDAQGKKLGGGSHVGILVDYAESGNA